jgi:hypothetical protein
VHIVSQSHILKLADAELASVVSAEQRATLLGLLAETT